MKKILLVCNLGMSTSLLVERMKTAAKDQNIEAEIEAVPYSVAEKTMHNWDIVLLGPQVRHQMKGLVKVADGKIPVEVIDMRDYGLMNGPKVLDAAINGIENFNKY